MSGSAFFNLSDFLVSGWASASNGCLLYTSQGTPDFLRQISSLLRSGVGVETAMEDISKHGEGPLTDELKRAVIEIKIGSTFEAVSYTHLDVYKRQIYNL